MIKTTRVENSINETSEKIDKVKRIVAQKKSSLPFDKTNAEKLDNKEWKSLNFLFPNKTIRLATAFSGIGAIEHAFQRLKPKHKIVFAGDIDENCRKSYFANYKLDQKDWFTDIREFDATKYKGQVDFLVVVLLVKLFQWLEKD